MQCSDPEKSYLVFFFLRVSFPLDQPVELTHLAAVLLLGMIWRNQSEYMPLTDWGT